MGFNRTRKAERQLGEMSGGKCKKDGWQSRIHRRKRCDLSLFQLGLRLLEHFLNEDLRIAVQFHITI